MGVLLIIFILVISVVSGIYLFVKKRSSYWKDRNVLYDEPHFIFGNLKGIAKTRHFSEILRETYMKYKGKTPFVGYFFFSKPAAFILDLDLVKNILIKDFSNFVDRGQFVNVRDDPLTGHLFALDGQKWKSMRTKLSPTFTSGKMKFMFPTVRDVGERFSKTLGEYVKDGAVVEVKDLNARFTTDVIGTCAFGIECNSLKDPNAEFRVMGTEFFTKERHNQLVQTFIQSYPKLATKLRFKLNTDQTINFFLSVVRDTVKYREENNIKRNDFMDMLIELKNNKKTYNENGEEISGITMEEMAAQAFVFFIAGFETSSTTMGFLLYELAQNQDIQDRVRKEINSAIAANNGEFSYEAMKQLKYTDQVISETLRKYSVLSFLVREALNDYKVPDSNMVIDAGTLVMIPVDSIQHDPEYYPNPEIFDPDRFTPEEIQKRHSCTWLPFGDGPRNCIGLRFGKMQARIGLVQILRKFKFSSCAKTEIPIKIDVKTFLLGAAGGIYLQVDPVEAS